MAVPRPVLLALLGFALIVSALLATRGVGGTETVTPPTTPAAKPQPVHAPAKASKPAPAHTRPAAPKHAVKPKKPAKPTKPAGKVATATKLPTGVSPRILPVVQALGRNEVVVLF